MVITHAGIADSMGMVINGICDLVCVGVGVGVCLCVLSTL